MPHSWGSLSKHLKLGDVFVKRDHLCLKACRDGQAQGYNQEGLCVVFMIERVSGLKGGSTFGLPWVFCFQSLCS